MKKLAIGLCLFVGIICRSEAQLDGEYTFDISNTFGTNVWFYEDGNPFEGEICWLRFSEAPDIYLNVGTEAVHNPKTGAFRVSGQSDFGGRDGEGELTPAYLNPLLPNTDGFVLTSATTTIIGKTYTSKSTGKPTIDISSGLIKIAGQYDIGSSSVVLVAIKNGSVSFKKSGIDAETAEVDGVLLKVSGSAVLNNKQVKKFNSQPHFGSGMWGGYPYSSGYESGGVTYTFYASEYLNLDIQTNGSAIIGTAEFYTRFAESNDTGEVTQEWLYPSEEAKHLKYSVKGTSKNGIATLNLTGLGVIKGLKATICIDEDTEEIIQNGKNSITLYGQTIKY